jgi:hypothetical protein
MESETPPLTISRDDAARMLAEVQAANAELARRAVAPVWYHPALGLLAGGMVVALNAPAPWAMAYNVVFLVGCGLLVLAYRRKTGLWINGYRKGRTRWIAVGLGVGFAALALGGVWLKREHGLDWAPWAGGAAVFVLATIAGFGWEAAFRRDLRDGDAL